MSSGNGMRVLSRLHKDFFLIVAKLHIYEYHDYKFCRLQSRFGKLLPDLTEEDFLALRACELYGTYDDWVDYHMWSSVPFSIPENVRENEVSLSFEMYNPNLHYPEDNLQYVGDAEDFRALIACILHGTVQDWEFYLDWTSNPLKLHNSIRDAEVDIAFTQHNPNIIDFTDEDKYLVEDIDFADTDAYVKDRSKRANRIKNNYIKDKKHVYKTCAVLKAKEVAFMRKLFSNAPGTYPDTALISVIGEDLDGFTSIKKTVTRTHSPNRKYYSYSSSHKAILENRMSQLQKQEVAWRQDRFHQVQDATAFKSVMVYPLTPIYVDVQMSEPYRNNSHRGSLKRKVSAATTVKLKNTESRIKLHRTSSPRFTNTIFVYGGAGLPI